MSLRFVIYCHCVVQRVFIVLLHVILLSPQQIHDHTAVSVAVSVFPVEGCNPKTFISLMAMDSLVNAEGSIMQYHQKLLAVNHPFIV